MQFPKRLYVRSQKARDAARGQACTIRLPFVCNGNPETTVLCHSNLGSDGKGMGIKASDDRAAFGCSSCHDVLDGRAPLRGGLTRELVLVEFERAVEETQGLLRMMGINLKGDS